MDEQTRAKFCELIQKNGKSIYDNPSSFEEALLGILGQNTLELSGFLNSLKLNVPGQLIQCHEEAYIKELIDILSLHLQNTMNISELAAKWIVETWAIALGKLSYTEKPLYFIENAKSKNITVKYLIIVIIILAIIFLLFVLLIK